MKRQILLMLAFLPAAAAAQERMTLTVDEAVKIGLENSKSLHASSMNVEAAEARSAGYATQKLPQVKFGGSYTRLSDIPPAEIGPFPPILPDKVTLSPSLLENYNLRLSFTQPIFTGFRLQSGSNAAEYAAKAAGADLARDRSQLVYDITAAYWNLYKANEFKKVIDENVSQMKAHLADVRSLFDQGIVTKNEVLKVEVQLSSAQLLQLDAGNNVRLATIALNNTIGTPLRNEISVASVAPLVSREYGEVDSLIALSYERRPELEGVAQRVRAGEENVTAARSGWFPQVYLAGNYNYARPNARIFPALDQFKDTWDVSLSVSLDIWNWGATIHQTDEAQAQLSQARDHLGELRDGIALDVTQAYLTFGQSKERIGVAGQAVGEAEENYRITNEKFKAGLALNSDLLDAEVALLQAKWNSIQALVDHELADARLRKAIGEDTPHY